MSKVVGLDMWDRCWCMYCKLNFGEDFVLLVMSWLCYMIWGECFGYYGVFLWKCVVEMFINNKCVENGMC